MKVFKINLIVFSLLLLLLLQLFVVGCASRPRQLIKENIPLKLDSIPSEAAVYFVSKDGTIGTYIGKTPCSYQCSYIQSAYVSGILDSFVPKNELSIDNVDGMYLSFFFIKEGYKNATVKKTIGKPNGSWAPKKISESLKITAVLEEKDKTQLLPEQRISQQQQQQTVIIPNQPNDNGKSEITITANITAVRLTFI